MHGTSLRFGKNGTFSIPTYYMVSIEFLFDVLDQYTKFSPIAVYEVLSKLPQHGVGSKISRVTWMDNSFWTVTEVKMGLVRLISRPSIFSIVQGSITSNHSPLQNGKTGESYGILTWRGNQKNEKPTRINGSLKKLWRQLATHDTTLREEWPSLAIEALRTEQDTSMHAATDDSTTENTQGESNQTNEDTTT